jgi:hypothetical protein
VYTGIELEANYQQLVEKWGEWNLGRGGGAFSVRYIDVGNALFSGLMITFTTLSIVSFTIAIVFGKIIFPLLAKYFKGNNEEMVDMATLKSAAQIDKISNSKKEWF